MDETGDTSLAPVVEQTMKLTEVSYGRIKEARFAELYELVLGAGIQDDENLSTTEDLRERLILMKRKMEGSSNTWKHLFQSVKEETEVKSESLMELMKTVKATFQMYPDDSLSEVLRKEGHLQNRDLLEEISKRMKNLVEHRSLVIIAGETNGGKSTFLNLLLGEDILPTDVLHCTFAICKIVYSEKYSIRTTDHDNKVEHFSCSSREQIKELLRSKVSLQEMRERALGSPIKEITLGLPADILKSGVTLVDTPGIGEDENMDNVTMNFVKSTHASAFIYIIKSDTAGGVQEDRLLSFLRAIKERYSADTEVEAFDPRAAIFICHRWDNIDSQQQEKVKRNALEKLEYVWPGFEPSQTHFFSTKNTMKHLPVDPEFVTDSFMMLLKGLKQLFERASHNAIKYHYLWLKYMLQPASHHLRSMITHCIHNNEELEIYFKSVSIKQNRLMLSSEENSKKLQRELDEESLHLKDEIVHDLTFNDIKICNEIHDSQAIIVECSKDHFLDSKANRRLLDEMIIRSILKYVDERVHERNTVVKMESKILMSIEEHLGLFGSQINQIKHVMQHGGYVPLTPSGSRNSIHAEAMRNQLGSSTWSNMSAESNDSSVESFRNDMTLDTTQLASKIKSLLAKRKSGKSRRTNNSQHEFQESMMSKIKNRIRIHIIHNADPEVYVEKRMHKIAKDILEDAEVMDSIMTGYTEWIQQCVTYSTNSIPKFIKVNNTLMDVIREHRANYQRNKDILRKVMEDLEPSRHYLRGYGLLYMDDINAEMLAFNMQHRNSSVFFPKDLVADHRPNDDSGFQGSGSRKRKVQSLWARMQGATIKINNVAEQVVVKTYIYDMEEKAVLSEIASLRCLDYVNLASFLGMTRIVATGSTRGDVVGAENLTEKVSAFIFKGDLVSAHVYSRRKMTNMQLFIPDLVHSLLQGLNYIHREGLVHMELNLNTVMVERLTGVVKLCQMCKPREARFPANMDIVTQTCVCLSPSVLQGNEYESTDDMYAFGLLLWELLFPDKLPYEEQRIWTLRRFIQKCHPTQMLEDGLFQLKVSENVREVLKGTLLLSRKNICMPIGAVQSLLVDIADEPAVQCLPSRPKNIGPRRRSSASSNPPDLATVMPKDFESVKPSPQRPPRRKDNHASIAPLSVKTNQEIQMEKPFFPPKNTRRQSEPVLSTYNPSLPSMRPGKKFIKSISHFFGRRSSKVQIDEELQTSDISADMYKDMKRRQSIDTEDETDGKTTATGHNEHSPPDLKPKFDSSVTRKVLSGSKTHSRKSSLQEQSLYTYSKSSPQSSDSVDVPSLFKRFSVNLGDSLTTDVKIPSANPMTSSQKDYFLNGSMPSLLLSDGNSKSEAIGKYKKHPTSPNLGSFPQSRVSSKAAKANVSESGAINYSKLYGQRFGRSLQDLSAHHPNQEVGRLANSLQDISDVSHAIGPIVEEKVDTQALSNEDAEYNITGLRHIKASRKKNYGFHGLTSPAVSRQSAKLSTTIYTGGSTSAENVDSSSSPSSSLSSSLENFSGLSTDVSEQEQKIPFALADVSKIEFSSEPETSSWPSDNTFDKRYYEREQWSFDLQEKQSTLYDNYKDTTKSQETYSLVRKRSNIKFTDSSDPIVISSRGSLTKSVHFQFEDIDSSTELASENTLSSLISRSPEVKIASSSSPLNFSKFSFERGNHSDDDNDFSFG